MQLTVIPSVPRAFCLIAMAMRFFSARVSLRAASIFRLTSACSLRASRRFSAKVPIPSSLDTCSSLCKLVIESVPISIYNKKRWFNSFLLCVYEIIISNHYWLKYYLCRGVLGGQTTQQSKDERKGWSSKEFLPNVCIQATKQYV